MAPPPPLCYLDLQFYQFTNLFFLFFYSNNKFTSRCKLVDRSINRKIYRFVRVIHSWWTIISYKSALLCSFVIIYKRGNFRFLFFFRFLLLPSSSQFFTLVWIHDRIDTQSFDFSKSRHRSRLLIFRLLLFDRRLLKTILSSTPNETKRDIQNYARTNLALITN